jgi:hypothetical protein
MPSRTRHIVRDLVALTGLLVLSWCYYGFSLGSRGFISGDDWYLIAVSSFDQLPACTGFENFHNPWRPLVPTPVCLYLQVFGRSGIGLMSMPFVVYGFISWAWYGITRNVFGLSSALALVLGFLFLSYPDDNARYTMVGGLRQFGPLLALFGTWLVLSFWDNPYQKWRFIVGLFIAAISFLAYENLLLLWTVGLPVALAYKSGWRLSRRWLVVTAGVIAVPTVYLIWRFGFLPSTYDLDAGLAGEYTVRFDPQLWFRQFTNSYALLSLAWQRPLNWLSIPYATLDGALWLNIPRVAVLGALAALASIGIVSRLDDTTYELPRGAILIGAMVLVVPLVGGIYYFSTINLLQDQFRTSGISFAGSLGLVGALLLIRHPVARFGIAGLFLLATIGFMVVGSGHIIENWQTQSGLVCDFFSRLTSQVGKLPQNVYTVIREFESPYETTLFHDTYYMSSALAAIYNEGPYGPATYDYRRMGLSGYFLFVDSRAELDGERLRVDWAGQQTADLHAEQPLPDSIPLDQALLIEYAPMQELRIVSIPEGIDDFELTISLEQPTEPSARVRAFCDWR